MFGYTFVEKSIEDLRDKLLENGIRYPEDIISHTEKGNGDCLIYKLNDGKTLKIRFEYSNGGWVEKMIALDIIYKKGMIEGRERRVMLRITLDLKISLF